MHYDVIVIGGGASGMQAAVVAAERGLSVLLLEKNKTLGVKLSITGGGRCNILNAEPEVRTLLSHYGDAAPFLFSPFSQYGMQATYDWFEQQHLPLKIEANRRAFPVTDRATDVVALFESLLKKYGVAVKTGVAVTRLQYEGSVITAVETTAGRYTATSYIVATGGLSRTETGSTGDGHRWLTELGLSVHRPNPSLVPLVTADAWMHVLSGVTLADAELVFTGINRTNPVRSRGKVLFTHFGLSGPAALNAAAGVRQLLSDGAVTVTINLWPQYHTEAMQAQVQQVFDTHKNKLVQNVIKFLVPPGLATVVISQLPQSLAATAVHSVSRVDRHFIAQAVHYIVGQVTGTKGNDWAIVSDGGLDLTEVDTKTMRIRKVQNLYVTGDVLHISRPSGGYSLQLCWTTGTVAGRSIPK